MSSSCGFLLSGVRLFFGSVCLVFLSASLSAQIINIEDKRSIFGDTSALYESLELSATLVKNEQQLFSILGAAQVEFSFKNRLLLSLTKASFFKAGDENFVNQGFQHIRYNVEWAPWLIYELFGQAQYNEQANIKIRALAGTGLRFRLFGEKTNRMYLGLSYMFEYDEEKNNEIVHHDSRMNTYLSMLLSAGKFLKFSSTTYFQPLFNNFNDFRLSSESEAEFQITKKLMFTTTFSYAYDSMAPQGAPSTLYTLSNGLEYHF